MALRRRLTKAMAVLSILILIATACGGGNKDQIQADAPGAVANQATGTEAIATTEPLTVDGIESIPIAAEELEAAFRAPQEEAAEPTDPWQVTVLQVNDDVQIIPAFDAPNGNSITIYDVNEIDGIQLEYPLYADTVFGNRLALVVEQFDSSGAWAEVGIPVRPNGTTAWVQTAFFSESTHNYHITIDLSENKVNVFKGDELLVEQIAVSGRESRPTPVVRAYIDEKISGPSLGPAYGTWVLSIAAFSESLGTFGGGGMPKLALHGTNQPDLIGQYISSGCVRVPNDIIDFIAESVPVGTIIDIVA